MRKIVQLFWILLLCLTLTMAMECFQPNNKRIWEKYDNGDWHQKFLTKLKVNINRSPQYVQNIIIQYLIFDLFSKKINTFFPALTKTLVNEFTIAFPFQAIFHPMSSVYYDIVPYLLFIDKSRLIDNQNKCPNLQQIYQQLTKYSLPLGNILKWNLLYTSYSAVSWDFSSTNLYIYDFESEQYTKHTLTCLPLYTKFSYLGYNQFGWPDYSKHYDLILMKNYKLLRIFCSSEKGCIRQLQYEVNLNKVPSATKTITKIIQIDFPDTNKSYGENWIYTANYLKIDNEKLGNVIPHYLPKNGFSEIIIDPKVECKDLGSYQITLGFYLRLIN